MTDSKYNFYGNFDKNIKAIKGGGVIVPSNPPNRTSSTDTIKNTWYKDLKVMPPLFKAKYYSNPDLTNGYLNSNNHVQNDKYINDYYYPSQKMNDISYKIDNPNELTFPPPLINSKYVKKNKKNNNNKNNKSKLNNKLDEKDKKIIENIKQNSLYDGKYIYTIEEPNDINNIKLTSVKIIPMFDYDKNNISKLNNFNVNNNDYEKINNIDLSKSDDIEEYENLTSDNILNSNFTLLLIFSVLLIIFFNKIQK